MCIRSEVDSMYRLGSNPLIPTKNKIMDIERQNFMKEIDEEIKRFKDLENKKEINKKEKTKTEETKMKK